MNVKNTSDRREIRLAGEGGQGLILAGIILAEAAAVYEGKKVVQTQSYGPEARGGASKSEVIISASEIDYPKVINADVLVVMSQEACDKYSADLRRDGLMIVDSGKVGRVPTSRAIKLPITQLAVEATGKGIPANVVALGVLVGLSRVVSREAIEKAVMARAPRGTEEMNRAALAAGFEASERLKGTGVQRSGGSPLS